MKHLISITVVLILLTVVAIASWIAGRPVWDSIDDFTTNLD